jgi:hypothetical protein
MIPVATFGPALLIQACISVGYNLLVDEDYFNLSTEEAANIASELIIYPVPL